MFAFQANANRTQSSACVECSSSTQNMAAKQLRELRNTVTAQSTVEDLIDVTEVMTFADKCDNFVDEDGLGTWGQTIAQEMHKDRYEYLYQGTPDLVAVCPAFNSLNDNGKEMVWVMIINTMVHLESSCAKSVTAKGPNGTLKGLLQLHKGREQVYADGCRRGDADSPAATFRCGLAMLDKQLETQESLFSRKSYWDVLRPQARSQKFKKVQRAISKIAFCK
ncbi:hypothetical protein [Bdellovibrio sp. ArHS]|uniref:hypothetical protein n=1 Tax=Bdellovibrio sp. ArHS TaxID=1569284 RepID=UPI0025C5EAF3|nr:hypothetical protein [Bdellovibrio sp. ArHS]